MATAVVETPGPIPMQATLEEQSRAKKAAARATAAHTSHMQEYHGLRKNKAGMLYRSIRRPHQAMDTTEHEPIYAIHETTIKQSSRWVRGGMNDDGTPLMREEAVRFMNQSYNETRGREWLTPREVATVLSVSNDVVYRILRKKALVCYRPAGGDGRVRVTFQAMQSFMTDSDYTPEQVADAVTRARALVAQQTPIAQLIQQTPCNID